MLETAIEIQEQELQMTKNTHANPKKNDEATAVILTAVEAQGQQEQLAKNPQLKQEQVEEEDH